MKTNNLSLLNKYKWLVLIFFLLLFFFIKAAYDIGKYDGENNISEHTVNSHK
ncbi:hypothetical protein [Leptobacterium sp. I13]|uniref:hypothetical protein n=1 Tax=Leptobacterium meishanense TaxID=3128904 RepID=UPI0030EF4712